MAIWLPTYFYLLSLILAYFWANKIWTERLFAKFPNLNAGHFLVIFLGLNSSYFLFTSRPYTEGLAFVLLFSFLLRSHSLLKSPRILNGLEIGIWLGLLLLTRSQWLIVVVAVTIAYVFAIFGKQNRYLYLGMALTSATSLMLVLLPFWVYVAGISEETRWFNFFHFSARPNSLLSIPAFAINESSFSEFLKDRLSGFSVAFGYLNRYGYFSIFHEFIYLIPVAFIVLLTSLRQLTVQKIKSFVAAVEQNDKVAWYLPVLIAIGAFAVIHLLHNDYISEWYFRRRHAIPVVLLVFFSFIYLVRRKSRLLNFVLFTILFSGTMLGLVRNIYIVKNQQHETALEFERGNLAEWLEGERKSAGRKALTIAVSDNEGQRLVWRTRKINYHWVFHGATTYSDYQTLFGELACDYLVLRNNQDSADYPLPDNIERVAEDFEHFEIYRVDNPPDVDASS